MIRLSDHLHIEPMGKVLADARLAKAEAAAEKRHFAAAKLSRLNDGWTTQSTTANRELMHSLKTLRGRAREAVRNNSHFKKFLNYAVTNTVGASGIQLQVRARKKRKGRPLNVDLNQRVEEAFWYWTHKENCTVTKQMTFIEAQQMFVTNVCRDGEGLIVHRHDAKNPFGYALQFKSPDWLDEAYNDLLPNGNRIIMSVEVDADFCPVAYWFTTPASEMMISPQRERKRERISADRVTHAFLKVDDGEQIRGITWFHSALVDAKNLHGYKEAVIMAARVGASVPMFLMEEMPDDGKPYAGEDDEQESIDIDVSPMQVNHIPAGYRLEQFDPKQPTQNHSAFYQSILKDLAVGLGVNYFSLAGDMAAVNYSSARVGLREERDLWKTVQRFVIDHFCREIYHHWLKAAVLSKQLSLTAQEWPEVRDPKWRPRGWEFVDPQKEIAAHVTALQNKVTTLTDVLAERGIDPVEHFETLQQEKELAAQYGIELNYGTAKTDAAQGDDDMDEKPDPKPADDDTKAAEKE